MAELGVKPSPTGNVVAGFSERFNLLLDRARVPKQNRITAGSKRFDVVPNTFKSWCVADKIPGTHQHLLEIVDNLLHDIVGQYDVRAVCAWLLAGDAVPNPFADDTDALALVELYLQISDVAKSKGIIFNKLPRDAQNLILSQVRGALPRDVVAAEGVQLDKATLAVVVGMLEMARKMT